MQDPRWSYASVTALNAGIVNRKTFIGQVPGKEPHAAFETLAAKGEAFFGVVAVTRRYGPAPPLAEATYQHWYGSALGVHLSTFPP